MDLDKFHQLLQLPPTIIHKIPEAKSSFHVK